MPHQITVARAEPGRLAHFPDIVRLADGRLLAAYREGAGHLSPEGRICLVESADDGQTWGQPRIVVDGPFDDRDPKLARLADGTVLLSYFVLDWSTKPRHTTCGTFVRRSTDGGRTWSEPVEVGSAMPGTGPGRGVQGWAASHGAAVELPGGDLLFPLYGKTTDKWWHQATVVRSTDGGRTWPAESEVLVAAADEVHFQEPTLTVLDDQIVALIRTTVEHAYLSRSTDGGHTWTTPQATDMPASSHHALRLSTGEVLVTYGDLSSRFSAHRETVGRLVRQPEDTWDGYGDVQLYDSGDEDQANPSSVELEPGHFLTLGFDVGAATVVGVFTERDDYPR
ncbi:sialidase family protein [Jidongwangia harbinensis]|uniref:sialidase family protein n=1 Tax=Jidongwangia harbinensis TaxID=2878561 RepID=UPI001CD9BA24|nr:sialidase family protein [Jidongwangia harbinensis]MCA2215738.1 glycoside hydrolase [Jidongwangia harbinensis]